MSKKKPITYSEWCKNNRKNYLFVAYGDNPTNSRKMIPAGTTRKKARSELRKIIEFEQLLAIRNTWIGDWDEYTGYAYAPIIYIQPGSTITVKIMSMCSSTRISRLTFPTPQMCTEFIKRFETKIKKALL